MLSLVSHERFGILNQRNKTLVELLDGERLRDEGISRVFPETQPAGERGNHKNWQVGLEDLQSPRQLNPVHPWHHVISGDDVKFARLEHLQGGGSILSLD